MVLPTSAQQQQSNNGASQGLPSIASLTNGLGNNRPSQHKLSPDSQYSADLPRDSGTWPHPTSKHNSANSQGLQVRTLLNPDDSPPRGSNPNTPQSGRNPNSAQSATSQLPSLTQGFEAAGNRASVESSSYVPPDSRRSSVDSRMHQGFSGLYINNQNPTSPHESANTSQVSLAASLRRPNGAQPMSPLSGRSSMRAHPAAPRVAPPIMPVGRMPGAPDPMAARPTQGYAWAFPEHPIPEEGRRESTSGESSINGVSRQNSFAASSIRSSIFSTDSQLPHGQKRFGDDEAATTHHHTMQHRTVQSLQNEGFAAQSVGNYSRTPELRVSHKLAERKRRSEMKDLFDELNKAVPANGGSKASKWEVLTKAIEYIRTIQHQEHNLKTQLDRAHHDAEYARDANKENEMLRTEVQVMHQHLRRLEPNAPHVYGHLTSQLSAQQPHTNGGSISLPPLQTGTGSSNGGAPSQFGGNLHSPVGAMQGVEYGGNYGR